MFINQILTKLKSLVYSKSETDSLLNGKASSSHTHTKSQITDFPAYGNTAGTICQGNDSRLSDARTPTSHTHTKSQITDFPTIPTVNNATLKIQKNGTDVATFTANASSNVTANISVPTKTSQLTNDSGFITSSSNITGTSAAANKLTTARSISAGDLEFQGSANFDGSGNIKLDITHHRSIVTIGNTNNYPFHRIAYTAVETGDCTDRAITFFIGKEYAGGGYGICRIVLRTNNASGGATATCEVTWLVRTSDVSVDAIQVGFNNTAAASYIDVFYKSAGRWGNATCRVISHASSRNSVGRGFTVVPTSSERDNTTTSDPLTSTESYATIAAAGTKIRGKAYTSTITASDAGIANYATYNANGKELVNSIIKGLSVSGRTITYTKLDGSTGTITTQDTTYTLPTASSTLGGVKTTSTVSNSSGYTACPIISGVPYYKDTNTTYSLSSLGIGNVKNYDQSKAIKSISRSGTTFTYTCLDGTTGTFTQQDNNTTYSFSDKNVTLAWGTKSTIATVGGTDIHVTMPANPNTNTWTAMKGATSSANGSVGYVNAVPPKDGYNTKYLRADGTWQVPPDHTYTVNNATLTIQKNGSNVATFTANASSNVTANISVPTKVSQLTNDSGFITSSIDSQSLGTSGWIKFKNGLQICWEIGILRNSLGTLYSWNKAFKTVFVAIASDVGPDNGNAAKHGSESVCIRPYSATQYRIGGEAPGDPNKTTFYIQYIAIGNWK